MQACCLKLSNMMRLSTATVAALQQVADGPPLLDAISSLHLQSSDMLAAMSMLNKLLNAPTLSSQHTCFITDHHNLVTALLPQMSRLETTATSSKIPLQATGFDQLWSLLISSCRVLTLWPMMWPTGHKLAFLPLLTTLDSLMSLLLLVTRTREVPWLEWEASGPLGRKTQAYTVLFLPMTSMINLAMNQGEQNSVLQTMPSMFFAKLCCLSCELLSDLPPVCHTAQRMEFATQVIRTNVLVVPQSAAFWSPQPPSAVVANNGCVPVTSAATQTAAAREVEINTLSCHPATRARFTSSYDLFFFYLAASAANFLREQIDDQHNPCVKMFVHPAVILAMKFSLVLRTGVEDKADLVQFDERTVITILTLLVDYSLQINEAVLAGPGGKTFTRSICGHSMDMGESVRPRVVVSDDRLLRTLCRRMCVDSTLVQERYNLMLSMINCWPAIQKDDSAIDLPFPVPDGGEQVCGIMTLVHHYSFRVLRWMRDELVKRKQQGGVKQGTGRSQVVVSHRQRMLDQSKCVFEMVLRMRCIFPLVDAVEGWEDGTLRQNVVFSPEILKLRGWMRGPGMFCVQEALLRSQIRPEIAGAVAGSIRVPLALLNYKLDPKQLNQVLPACLSMAATVRKVLYPVTHRVFANNKPPGLPPLILSTVQVNVLTYLHIQLINIMNKAMIADSRNEASCSSISSVSSSTSSSTSSCGGSSKRSSFPKAVATPRSTAMISRGAVNKRDVARALTAAERKVLYHRVQAVMMAGVVQLCHFQVESGDGIQASDGEPAAWVEEMFTSLDDPGNGVEEFLEDHITSLLSHPTTAQQEVGPKWEAYARENFEQHMLPGCCYLGCRNLTGVAEAALPTQLCGGCKRVRYCGVACQRGAWVEGGHRTVCGNK